MKEPVRPLDIGSAHPARRYDYLLGGKDHYAADRESAEQILRVMPSVKMAALENRGFLQRGVEFLARQGVRQFLDIGTGIPTSPNVHEVAQAIDPTARIVYVDNDPGVIRHAQAKMTSTPDGMTAYIEADLRHPSTILKSAVLKDALDFNQPIALLLVAVLHFIRDDEDPDGIVDTLVNALPAGSWVVVSHATFDYVPPERLPKMEAPNTDGRFRARSAAKLGELLHGVDLIPPGIQSAAQWWPEHAPQPRPPIEDVAIHAALGRVRTKGDTRAN